MQTGSLPTSLPVTLSALWLSENRLQGGIPPLASTTLQELQLGNNLLCAPLYRSPFGM